MAITKVTAIIGGTSYPLTLVGGVWTAEIPSSGLSVGTMGINLTAVNSTGYTTKGYAEFEVEPEKTPPTVRIESPSPDSWINNSKPAITFVATDNAGGSGVDLESTKVWVDDNPGSVKDITSVAITNGYRCIYTPSTALSDGVHVFRVQVSDNAGNVSQASSQQFRVDVNAPNLSVSEPQEGSFTNNPRVSVSGSASDIGAGLREVLVNGSPVELESDGSFSTTVQAIDGLNTISVVAYDNTGKSATVSRSIILDRTPPSILGISIAPDFSYWNQFIVTVTLEDPGEYAAKELVSGSCNSSPLSFSEISKNVWAASVPRSELYAIEVTATDAAGNSSSESIRFDNGYDLRWDWTYQDFLNYWDLNRIETATKSIRGWLHRLGYTSGTLPLKTDWVMSDVCRRHDMDRVKQNVDALQFFPMQDWVPIEYRDSVDSLQVNAIEFDLWLVDFWLVKAELTSTIHSDMINSGMWP